MNSRPISKIMNLRFRSDGMNVVVLSGGMNIGLVPFWINFGLIYDWTNLGLMRNGMNVGCRSVWWFYGLDLGFLSVWWNEFGSLYCLMEQVLVASLAAVKSFGHTDQPAQSAGILYAAQQLLKPEGLICFRGLTRFFRVGRFFARIPFCSDKVTATGSHLQQLGFKLLLPAGTERLEPRTEINGQPLWHKTRERHRRVAEGYPVQSEVPHRHHIDYSCDLVIKNFLLIPKALHGPSKNSPQSNSKKEARKKRSIIHMGRGNPMGFPDYTETYTALLPSRTLWRVSVFYTPLPVNNNPCQISLTHFPVCLLCPIQPDGPQAGEGSIPRSSRFLSAQSFTSRPDLSPAYIGHVPDNGASDPTGTPPWTPREIPPRDRNCSHTREGVRGNCLQSDAWHRCSCSST